MGLIPLFFSLYLAVLHTYLVCTKKSTLQLILESRLKNRIHPVIKKTPEETLGNPDGEMGTPNPLLMKDKNFPKTVSLKNTLPPISVGNSQFIKAQEGRKQIINKVVITG